MKTYKLEITDNDGETHEYIIKDYNPWKALNQLYMEILADKNWYGHKPEETIGVNIMEII